VVQNRERWARALSSSDDNVEKSSLIKRLKFSDDVLRHNTNQLIRKKDIHETLEFLSRAPYGLQDQDSQESQNDRVILFIHKISNKDSVARVPPEYCPCNVFNL
jgi:hypothetical protein